MVWFFPNPEDEPFIPKSPQDQAEVQERKVDLLQDQPNEPEHENDTNNSDESTKQLENDKEQLTVETENQQQEHLSQQPEKNDIEEAKNEEIKLVKEKDVNPSTEKVVSSLSNVQSDRDDYEVFADQNLRPLSSNERLKLIEENEKLYSGSRFKMILFIIIAIELLILFIKSKIWFLFFQFFPLLQYSNDI